MNSQNSLLVPFIVLFLVFLIILPCNSVSPSSRKKSGSERDAEKYVQRREREESDRTSRKSSGNRAKSGQRKKSDHRRRKKEDEEEGDRYAADKYKYNRNRDEGTSRRDGDRRSPSRNRELRGRPTERSRKSHGKQVEYEIYERQSRRISRSKSRGERKSGGGSDEHHRRRSKHERVGHDCSKRNGGNGEGRHRHSSSNRERRRGSSSNRRSQSQTRREGKSVNKSEAHKCNTNDYDEKTVPFLNRYAQEQKFNKDYKQPSSNKSVGSFSKQPKNPERQSTGLNGEKNRRSGKREKSSIGKGRSSSERQKSPHGQRQYSSGSGGNREVRPVSGSGGGRVESRMGRPVVIDGVEAEEAKPKQSELEKDAVKNPQPRTPNPIIWAVARGFNAGINKTWAECLKNIENFPNALFRTFDSEKEANKFIKNPEEFDGLSLAGGSRTGQAAYFHKSGVTAVYTDGSTKGGVTSIGVFWGDGDPRNTGEIIEDADADTGEYWAIIRAMEIGLNLDGLAIRTDYKSALDVINNSLDNLEDGNDEWRNRHGKRIKNIGLFRRIKALRQQFLDRHAPIYFEKVDAHSGDYGNNQADRLARKARNVVSHYVVPNYGIFTVHRHTLNTGVAYARRFYDRLPAAIECYKNLSN